LTLSEIAGVKGSPGDFEVEILKHPRYVRMDKCIGCGTCAEKCPKKVDDGFNQGLVKRKAVYVEYAQAVPLKYAIDAKECIFLQKGKCKACEKFCPTHAIDFEEKEEKRRIRTGAIILAPGFQPYDPGRYLSYKYAKYPNVVTSMEFERILSATGPFQGHLVRPSDHKEPQKIAWLQCIGSRDVHHCDHAYCSSVCCMYAIKEAVIAKEHSGSNLDCAVFYMDMRTHGKEFERYYEDAKGKHGVRFVRSRVPTVEPVIGSDDLMVPYVSEAGELMQERFDMVVLSVGLEVSPDAAALAAKMGLNLTESRFCETRTFAPVRSSREGIYVCGAFQGPKDIPQSVIEAGSAAAEAGVLLSNSRNTLTKAKPAVQERKGGGKRPRVGVFVCHCGINISGIVDVPAVRDYAATLPFVEYVTDNLFTCSTDTQDTMAQVIREKDLNRIVVAACTPKTHEPLFQETLVNAGLNKYLFEMTNIRNQDSWVHKDDPKKATEKAMDLVRMAVARVALSEPLKETEVDINQRALVVGGGISGMTAAKTLSGQGYQVCLVERSSALGGQALNLFRTWKGEDIQENVAGLVESVRSDPNIDVRLDSDLGSVAGFVGNFRSTLTNGGKEDVVEHGIAVISTGAREFKPDEYLYGKDPRVLTHTELDRKFMAGDPSLRNLRTAVFVQCVGSREGERPYCSRVCCTHSIESALHLKELNPDMNIYILYRDIRTYGEREILYRKARAAGVLFIQFSRDRKPAVNAQADGLRIELFDRNLGQSVEIRADLLALASAIVPYKDERLAQLFKVPMNQDGFFVEAHAKLGPSEFATDGVFLCGMAHYPKPIDESIAQAQAAVSRAVTLLARKKVQVTGTVAAVNPLWCSSCGVCIEVCPYSAPSVVTEGPFVGRAQVNPALCKGCGLCVASCRSGALNLRGFEERQIMAMISEM
jgi:heterodisulfide reductase subunit A